MAQNNQYRFYPLVLRIDGNKGKEAREKGLHFQKPVLTNKGPTPHLALLQAMGIVDSGIRGQLYRFDSYTAHHVK